MFWLLDPKVRFYFQLHQFRAVLHCKNINTTDGSIRQHSPTMLTTPQQPHDDRLPPLHSPGSLQARPIKSISHINQVEPRELGRPQEHADHPDTHSPPAAAALLGRLSPREPAPWSSEPDRQRGILMGGGRGCHRGLSLWFRGCRGMGETQADASCEINKSMFLRRAGSAHM